MMTTLRFVAPAALVALASLTACGANASTAEVVLSARGEEGQRIARSNGCASCHGTNGQGGVGPTFVGLFGSQVELQDADPVEADRDYLIESIVEPGARRVEGYRLQMPTNNLSEDEVDAVVAYIIDLAGSSETIEPSSGGDE